MRYLLPYIEHISTDINFLKSQTYNEESLNDVLYRHICAHHTLSSWDTGKQTLVLNEIEASIEEFYERYTHHMMTDAILTKSTKKLSLQIAHKIDIAIAKFSTDELRSSNLGLIGNLLLYKSPITTRSQYDKLRKQRRVNGRDLEFDFESLLRIAYITQRDDLSKTTAPELKKELLDFYLKDAIYTILFGIYNKLASIGIVKVIKGKYDLPIKSYIRVIYTSCAEDKLEDVSIEKPEESATEELKKRCIKHPDKSEYLISLLNELREKLLIYPSSCDKKTFGTLVYILYRGQQSIGLRKEAYTSFNKFKNVLTRYFGMPTSEFKPKNVDKKTIDKLYRNPVLNKVEEDPKWKTK